MYFPAWTLGHHWVCTKDIMHDKPFEHASDAWEYLDLHYPPAPEEDMTVFEEYPSSPTGYRRVYSNGDPILWDGRYMFD